jgi:hypothetical protein
MQADLWILNKGTIIRPGILCLLYIKIDLMPVNKIFQLIPISEPVCARACVCVSRHVEALLSRTGYMCGKHVADRHQVQTPHSPLQAAISGTELPLSVSLGGTLQSVAGKTPSRTTLSSRHCCEWMAHQNCWDVSIRQGWGNVFTRARLFLNFIHRGTL